MRFKRNVPQSRSSSRDGSLVISRIHAGAYVVQLPQGQEVGGQYTEITRYTCYLCVLPSPDITACTCVCTTNLQNV